MVEAIVTITVIGILACSAIAAYDRVVESSRDACSLHAVDVLNQGVKKYTQLRSIKLLSVPASETSAQEEQDILLAMQYDNPADHDPGAPYVRNDYAPPSSADTDDYRAVWNGAFFELRRPGQAGAGLKMMFDGSDFGHPAVFADDYVPLAAY